MIIRRKETSSVMLGHVGVGKDYPISIQSMTTTATHDIKQTLAQIYDLVNVGCEIVRLAVLNERDAEALPTLIRETPIPLVADIHYRADLAIAALKAGIHGLRLNPGNLSDKEKIHEIVALAKTYNPPIRIGVNAGSLDKKKYPDPTPENMVQSALDHIQIFEDLNYPHLKVSLKSSDIIKTVQANRLFSERSSYPLHLGVTEAGDELSSSIRSSAALGALLMDGIGDTIRISISGDPQAEPKIAKELLVSLHLAKGFQIIGCPTCGRKNIDVDLVIRLLKERLPTNVTRNLSIAIMGCIVNGLGEAAHADIGVVGIQGATQIYQHGVLKLKMLPHSKEKDIVQEILRLLSEDFS